MSKRTVLPKYSVILRSICLSIPQTIHFKFQSNFSQMFNVRHIHCVCAIYVHCFCSVITAVTQSFAKSKIKKNLSIIYIKKLTNYSIHLKWNSIEYTEHSVNAFHINQILFSFRSLLWFQFCVCAMNLNAKWSNTEINSHMCGHMGNLNSPSPQENADKYFSQFTFYFARLFGSVCCNMLGWELVCVC